MFFATNRNFKVFSFAQRRRFQELPTLAYSPEGGVYPVYSSLGGQIMLNHYHKRIVGKYNVLIEGSMDEHKSVEEVICAHRLHSDDAAILNASAQVWNYTFMWLCLYPYGNSPTPWLINFLDVYFGGINKFVEQWKEACMSIFGSGWVWLLDNNGFIEIMPSANSANPIGLRHCEPILAINLWEHAYYYDFGFDKSAYIDKWFEAVNWNFVEWRLKSVQHGPRIHPDEETSAGNVYNDDEGGINIMKPVKNRETQPEFKF